MFGKDNQIIRIVRIIKVKFWIWNIGSTQNWFNKVDKVIRATIKKCRSFVGLVNVA